MSSMRFATWQNIIYNTHEPNNIISLVGELTDANTYKVFQLWGYLIFSDGVLVVSVERNKDDHFCWRNGDKRGVALSIEEAWWKMPALVTNSDGYTETPMIYCDQYNG